MDRIYSGSFFNKVSKINNVSSSIGGVCYGLSLSYMKYAQMGMHEKYINNINNINKSIRAVTEEIQSKNIIENYYKKALKGHHTCFLSEFFLPILNTQINHYMLTYVDYIQEKLIFDNPSEGDSYIDYLLRIIDLNIKSIDDFFHCDYKKEFYDFKCFVKDFLSKIHFNKDVVEFNKSHYKYNIANWINEIVQIYCEDKNKNIRLINGVEAYLNGHSRVGYSRYLESVLITAADFRTYLEKIEACDNIKSKIIQVFSTNHSMVLTVTYDHDKSCYKYSFFDPNYGITEYSDLPFFINGFINNAKNINFEKNSEDNFGFNLRFMEHKTIDGYEGRIKLNSVDPHDVLTTLKTCLCDDKVKTKLKCGWKIKFVHFDLSKNKLTAILSKGHKKKEIETEMEDVRLFMDVVEQNIDIMTRQLGRVIVDKHKNIKHEKLGYRL